MNKNIPFTLDLAGKSYNGYLQTNDTIEPPKHFFVFLSNYIVGELTHIKSKWIFEQQGRYKFIGQLNTGECNYLAEYLGNIAVLAYE